MSISAVKIEKESAGEQPIKINDAIIDKVIALRGDKQLQMVNEECAELIQATSKYQRRAIGDNYLEPQKIYDNLVEEIADVYVVLRTAQRLLNISPEEINLVIEQKQDRLNRYMDAGLITAEK